MIKLTLALTFLLATAPVTATAQDIREQSVRAHERFLTSAPLRGRGSATPDEAVAAAYVAAQFEAAGLKPPPGMSGYIQTAPVIERLATGPAALTVDGTGIPDPYLYRVADGVIEGAVTVMADAKTRPAAGAILVYTGPVARLQEAFGMAMAAKPKLIIMPITPDASPRPTPTAATPRSLGKSLEARAATGATIVALSPSALAQVGGAKRVRFEVPTIARQLTTSNAIGFLPGTDPNAKLLLVTAHLDHLGVDASGVIRQGANDNASGTVAVIELARALAAGPKLRRGILFVAYGAEEAGLLGSRWFADHPAVPLASIAANIEFEMIGAQDPKLPKGALMMTGMERSDLGRTLTAHGALLAPDPYPTEHFYQRSDNYALAQKGIVAHVLSGWATVPTYHKPTDTFESIDFPFMTAAIRSLVEPIRALANATKEPAWAAGGRPTE
jgi:hypothetical protein